MLGVAGNLLSLGFFGRALGKARQLHRAVQGFNADGGCRDNFVIDKFGLDAGCDGCVIDVGASGLLASHYGTACADEGDAGQGSEGNGTSVFHGNLQ